MITLQRSAGRYVLQREGTPLGEVWKMQGGPGFGLKLHGIFWRNGQPNRQGGTTAIKIARLKDAALFAETTLTSLESHHQGNLMHITNTAPWAWERRCTAEGKHVATLLVTKGQPIVNGDPVIFALREDWMGKLSPDREAIKAAILATPKMLDALHIIASQSIGDDWTAEQALSFVKQCAKDAIQATKPTLDNAEIFPGATRAEIAEIMIQDIVGDYDTPDQVPEWQWIEQHASFSHQRNGQDGIWEFVLNLSTQLDNIPPRLQDTITQARAQHLSYLIFHQGT